MLCSGEPTRVPFSGLAVPGAHLSIPRSFKLAPYELPFLGSLAWRQLQSSILSCHLSIFILFTAFNFFTEACGSFSDFQTFSKTFRLFSSWSWACGSCIGHFLEVCVDCIGLQTFPGMFRKLLFPSSLGPGQWGAAAKCNQGKICGFTSVFSLFQEFFSKIF